MRDLGPSRDQSREVGYEGLEGRSEGQSEGRSEGQSEKPHHLVSDCLHTAVGRVLYLKYD